MSKQVQIYQCSNIDRMSIFDNVMIRYHTKHIIIESTTPLRTLSSAIVGGGIGAFTSIVNLKVDKDYRYPDPVQDAKNRVGSLHLSANTTIALMTAASLSCGAIVIAKANKYHPRVAIIATTGMRNAAHVLDNAPVHPMDELELRPGTINIICIVDGSLTDAALSSAIITATEAKCAALQTLQIRSPSDHIATGTTTDAIVIASTNRSNAGSPKFERIEYVGLATHVGCALGQSVYEAVMASAKWNLARSGT